MRMRILRAGVLIGVAAVLAACGGDNECPTEPPFEGSTNPSNCGTGTSSAPRASELSLALSQTTLSNDGTSTLTATATALNSNGNTVPEIPITIRVNNNAQATVSGTATDDKGVVSAAVGTGADRANRTVTVTAVSGSLTRTATFQVIGAKLTATPLPRGLRAGSRRFCGGG